ncbi:MAG TPA: serine hydrolase domain-containing protein [Thermoanaerobaculia bacterium]|jgi:CubicO group peptidase (beta-lactamase class C family)
MPHRRPLCVLLLAALAVLLAAAQPPQPAAPAPAARTDAALKEELDRFMSRLEAFGFSGSLLVARDGRIVLEKGYGFADRERGVPFTAETGFDIGSITKQFTAAAILKLEMAGKLKVTDPIAKYFEGVPEDKSGITLHHLLTHSAGLEDVFGGDYEEMPRDRLVKTALASKLLWPPGTRYRYSNAGYSLLAIIVEKVSGRPYETFLQERLFKPARLTKTGYRGVKWAPGTLAHGYNAEGDWGTPLDHEWAPDGPWWNLRGNGGILSTVGELYRWHRTLEGDAILSKEAKAKYQAPHVPEDEEGSSHYGYGWAIMKTPRGTRLITHNGGNGIFAADFRRYVDEGIVIVIGSNRSDFSSIAIDPQVARIVFGMEYALPPAPVKVESKALERFAGTYALPSGGRLIVSAAPSSTGNPRYPGLTVAGEGKDAFLLLAGGGAQEKDGGKSAEMERRLLEALEASHRGEFGPIATLFGVPLPQATEEVRSNWRRLEERYGPFRRSELLGTATSRGRATTYVRLWFENGSAVTEYGWEGPTVTTARVRSGPPGARFVPRSATELASYDPRSGTVREIAFETGEAGAVTALVVRTESGPVKAKRAG